MTYSKSRSFKIGSNVLFKIASSNCQRPLAAPSLERLADNSAFRQKISDMLVAFDQAVKVPTARKPKITRIRLGTMIWSVMDLFFNAATASFGSESQRPLSYHATQSAKRQSSPGHCRCAPASSLALATELC